MGIGVKMIMTHSFFQYCINPTEFENVRTLKGFISALKKQSNQHDAKIPYREDIGAFNDKDDDLKKSINAPRYFGAGVEALAEVFFQTFGMSDYNVGNYKSQDSIEEDLEDIGYDATAKTAKEKKYGKIIPKICKPGNTVYVQVKGSLNPIKEHTTNDGSRIPNFMMASMSDAISMGEGNSARYVLFTTAKGIHYKLEQNSKGQIEVIGFRAISKKIDNNPFFWNRFREKIGLDDLEITGPKDPDWQTMQQLLKKDLTSEAPCDIIVK